MFISKKLFKQCLKCDLFDPELLKTFSPELECWHSVFNRDCLKVFFFFFNLMPQLHLEICKILKYVITERVTVVQASCH